MFVCCSFCAFPTVYCTEYVACKYEVYNFPSCQCFHVNEQMSLDYFTWPSDTNKWVKTIALGFCDISMAVKNRAHANVFGLRRKLKMQFRTLSDLKATMILIYYYYYFNHLALHKMRMQKKGWMFPCSACRMKMYVKLLALSR